MDQSKPWWQSASIWGSVIAIGATLAQATGHPIAPDVIAGTGNLVDQLITAAAAGVALYGRVTASKSISK